MTIIPALGAALRVTGRALVTHWRTWASPPVLASTGLLGYASASALQNYPGIATGSVVAMWATIVAFTLLSGRVGRVVALISLVTGWGAATAALSLVTKTCIVPGGVSDQCRVQEAFLGSMNGAVMPVAVVLIYALAALVWRVLAAWFRFVHRIVTRGPGALRDRTTGPTKATRSGNPAKRAAAAAETSAGTRNKTRNGAPATSPKTKKKAQR